MRCIDDDADFPTRTADGRLVGRGDVADEICDRMVCRDPCVALISSRLAELVEGLELAPDYPVSRDRPRVGIWIEQQVQDCACGICRLRLLPCVVSGACPLVGECPQRPLAVERVDDAVQLVCRLDPAGHQPEQVWIPDRLVAFFPFLDEASQHVIVQEVDVP